MPKPKPSTKPKAPAPAAPAPLQKSWQARIGGNVDQLAVDFVESLSFDYRLAPFDIEGSIAHAKMLASIKLITKDELDEITAGLNAILADINAGTFVYDKSQEDIHMAVEAALIQKIGDAGRKLHTARSRNDQVALDIRLWCRWAIGQIIGRITTLQSAFIDLAGREANTPMPSFTHLQRAQPIVAGHELLAYAEMLDRDRTRLDDCLARLAINPLGAGAVAGSTLPIDRTHTANTLNLASITANSLDSISDRDFLCEFAFALSMVSMHLSRWAEQWILYVTTEFGFLTIADAYTTGSSMMPQKRNPDMLELIRGKTGGVYGQLIALLTMMKGQPLAYNRDMQEDKRFIFFAYDTVDACLAMATPIVATAQFNGARIAEKIDEGFSDATVLAEYLVSKGVAFRTAHHIVGATVAWCDKNGIKRLSDVPLEQFQTQSPAIGKDVYDYLGAANVLARYRSAGNGGSASVKQQIAGWKKRRDKKPSAKG